MTELIFDRTAEDVRQGSPKGVYGAADLNRVEQTVERLQRRMEQLDVHLQLQTKTDWDLPGQFSVQRWPTHSQMRRYRENVHQLCLHSNVDAQIPADMAGLTWEGANQIEYALHQVQQRVNHIINAYRYSGEAFSGEENIL